ncbi:hypothetical protein [Bradyrhizobium hereditatis]|nr:hypothetical protein [Bradyrhizobium hereditatis]
MIFADYCLFAISVLVLQGEHKNRFRLPVLGCGTGMTTSSWVLAK